MEFSLRPLHACVVRSRHVVEDRITLFVRPFGAYHVYGTFAVGSHRACHVQRIWYKYWIKSPRTITYYCNGYEQIKSGTSSVICCASRTRGST